MAPEDGTHDPVVLRAAADADADADELIALAQRSWSAVEESVDRLLGSPLDRLVTPSWPDHHEASVRDVLDDAGATMVVAERDGELIGFVGHRIHPPSAGMSAYGEVDIVCVAPEERGNGLGRRLVEHAVAALRADGAPVIAVMTGGDQGHEPARALYEAAGFTHLPTSQYWIAGADDA